MLWAVQFNVEQREITLKLVFYGPPLSGKTTNLQALHKLLRPDLCGRMTTLNTSDDRTLFFDLLPLIYVSDANYKIKLKLFTVPGQVVHAATRRVVLSGADGVVFVADSRVSESAINNEYFHGMRHYLKEAGADPENFPTVLQFNKRDLPNVRTAQELETIRKNSVDPVFEAVAIRGEGVVDTLKGLLNRVFDDLNQRHDFEKKFGLNRDDFLVSLFADAKEPTATPLLPPGADG